MACNYKPGFPYALPTSQNKNRTINFALKSYLTHKLLYVKTTNVLLKCHLKHVVFMIFTVVLLVKSRIFSNLSLFFMSLHEKNNLVHLMIS